MKASYDPNSKNTLDSGVDEPHWSVNELSAYLNQRCSTCKQYEDEDTIQDLGLDCYFLGCQNGLSAYLTAKPSEATAIAVFFPRQPLSQCPSFTLLCLSKELPASTNQLVWGGDAG